MTTETTLVTKADVQDATKLSLSTVDRLLLTGAIPYLKIGRSVRVRYEDLLRWMEAQRVTVR